MKVSDKKAIVREYFEHAANIREKKAADKRHAAMVVSDYKIKDKVFKERARTRIEHEEQNAAKKIARQKEVDKHQSFLKLSTALNII
ncbi:MAG: hypothetical protein WC635_10325 [Bacteriovorax sp.]|jgi:hypothetical protein